MTSVVPVLRVANAEAAAEWYGRLGFTVEWRHRFDPGSPLFVSITDGRGRIFLSEHAGDARRDTLLYLYVDDVDALARELGADVSLMPWGVRETQVRDLDGNRIRIGTPVE
jgi:catechol 2,3-dioxygenase-like lactoylglutathione lyase family enzyme